MQVRFGIFTDLHVDFMHDATYRFKKFLSECIEMKVDFCIQLGDFCPPNGVNSYAKEEILEHISKSSIPFYHVLGNHDMDVNSKKQVLDYIGASDSHESFDVGNIHFVILDACFYQLNAEYVSYDCGNYKNLPEHAFVPVLPPSELAWLEEDLNKTEYPTIIFSHQSLVESRAGIRNAEEFRKVINFASRGVLACICGHEHVDRLEEKDGVWYLCLNSMSYYWAGSKYRHETYAEEIVGKYEKLAKVFPYREPLYAIVEIDDSAISLHGKSSEFVGATPKELKFHREGLIDEVTASIKGRKIKV